MIFLKKHASYIFLKHANKKATRNIFQMAFFGIITNYIDICYRLNFF